MHSDQFTPTHRYLHGPLVDMVLAEDVYDPQSGQIDQTHWALADHLGTVRDVVRYDAAEQETVLVQHLVVDTFGNIVEVRDAEGSPLSEPPMLRFVYTGREWDAETGLYYYRARYYDPAAGRFLSPDPIGFAAGDANLYRYVGNAVTAFVDPWGLWPWSRRRMDTNARVIGEGSPLPPSGGASSAEAPPAAPSPVKTSLMETPSALDPEKTVRENAGAVLEQAKEDLKQHAVDCAVELAATVVPWGKGVKAVVEGGKLVVRAGGKVVQLTAKELDTLKKGLGVASDKVDDLAAAINKCEASAAKGGGSASTRGAKGAGDLLDRIQEAKRQFEKNRDFRNWAHKEFMEDMKMSGGGTRNPDISDSMIAEAYDEWLQLGRPKR